ncbi:hypothetical protein [Saliphagus sp. LR7]|uniref:hypothetical protein n=1 Tax=Saliphagus sp. LR7 TaxID=2282654 RepID=UPI001300541D|nr:hypothetical protein [Saliphagus sp. LR7]
MIDSTDFAGVGYILSVRRVSFLPRGAAIFVAENMIVAFETVFIADYIRPTFSTIHSLTVVAWAVLASHLP